MCIPADVLITDNLRQIITQNIGQMNMNINLINITVTLMGIENDIKVWTTSTTKGTDVDVFDDQTETDIINSVETELLLWMIKIIGAQLVICCLMVICIFVLKIRTFRLKSKSDEISKICHEIKIIQGELEYLTISSRNKNSNSDNLRATDSGLRNESNATMSG